MAFGTITETVKDDQAGTPSTSLVIDFATAANENDLILITAHTSDGGALTLSGFSSTCAFTEGSQSGTTFYKVAGASEGTQYTVTLANSVGTSVAISSVIEGPFDATPLDAAETPTKETGSGSIEGAVTTTNASDFILAGGYAINSGTWTGAAMDATLHGGFTILDNIVNASANESAIALATRLVTSSGSYSTKIQMAASGAGPAKPENWGFMVGFKEGAGGGTIIPQAMYHYRNNSGSGL